jgi:hypothetical protein
LESCAERYLELAKVDRKALKPRTTPFINSEITIDLPLADGHLVSGAADCQQTCNERFVCSQNGEV